MSQTPVKNVIKKSALASQVALFFTLCASTAFALPTTVKVTIPTVRLITGTEIFGDELYSRANINNSGWQQSGTVGGVDDGETIHPNWTFTSTIDPRGLASYNIPISLQLWEDDLLFDDQIDIRPTSGKTLNLSYNLRNRISNLSSPQTGNESGGRATFYFNVTSNPFEYLLNVNQLVTVLGPGLWEYKYALTNLTASTFDIDSWTIPFVGKFDLDLQPGQSFTTAPLRSSISPDFVTSGIIYDDLSRTSRTWQVLAPVPVPEPATLLLLGSGLLGAVLVRRKMTA